jgi:multiple antibiotic resistance protein
MLNLSDLWHTMALVPVTLLPIINPLSAAAVFSLTAGTEPRAIRQLARQVAINCWFVLVGSLFIGTYVLELFGISVPIVRIAGGLLVATSAWRMLNRNDDDEMPVAVKRAQLGSLSRTESSSAVSFRLRSRSPPGRVRSPHRSPSAPASRQPALYVMTALAVTIGATVTVAVVYLVYRNASALMVRLGEVGMLVMTRLLAFVLLCIGISIVWAGWAELNGITPPP